MMTMCLPGLVCIVTQPQIVPILCKYFSFFFFIFFFSLPKFRPDPACCRDASSTGVCGYPVTNYFIDWNSFFLPSHFPPSFLPSLIPFLLQSDYFPCSSSCGCLGSSLANELVFRPKKIQKKIGLFWPIYHTSTSTCTLLQFISQNSSSSPSFSPSAPSISSMIIDGFMSFYEFICRLWMLHMHKVFYFSKRLSFFCFVFFLSHFSFS